MPVSSRKCILIKANSEQKGMTSFFQQNYFKSWAGPWNNLSRNSFGPLFEKKAYISVYMVVMGIWAFINLPFEASAVSLL